MEALGLLFPRTPISQRHRHVPRLPAASNLQPRGIDHHLSIFSSNCATCSEIIRIIEPINTPSWIGKIILNYCPGQNPNLRPIYYPNDVELHR